MYYPIRNLARVLLRLVFDYRVVSNSLVPAEGAAILAANHTTGWDPLLVACAVDRPVAYMAKSELFRIPVLGALLPRIMVFPVRRGSADRSAVKKAIDILANGGALGIFPEGTRKHGEGHVPFPGVAYFAAKTGAMVIPVGVKYVKGMLRNTVIVRFGNPVNMGRSSGKVDSAVLQERTETVMEHIRNLVSGGGVS